MPSPSDVTMEALSLATADDPEDALVRAAYEDRPFYFGNDVLDQLSGIAHLAENAPLLLNAPTLTKTTAPAIAIGAGPSLGRYIDQIRHLQDRCVIVSCDTAYRGLVDSGIRPHLVTPLERHPLVLKMVPEDCQACYAGTPVSVPEAIRRCRSHAFVPGHDSIYDWVCLPDDERIAFGSSTGTMAAHVAAHITSGPVYLVGHDLCYTDGASHWDGTFNVPVRDIAGYVPGADGEQKAAGYWWLRFRRQIGSLAKERGGFVNVNAADGLGAAIDHVGPGHLPDHASLPRYDLTFNEARPERFQRWQMHAERLADDAIRLRTHLLAAESLAQTDIALYVTGPNGSVLSYYLQSIMVQMSYELRLGRTREFVLDWFKTAISNAIDTAMPTFRRIGESA